MLLVGVVVSCLFGVALCCCVVVVCGVLLLLSLSLIGVGVVCCVLFCCVLFVVFCSLCVVRCVLFVVCSLLCVVYFDLFDVCCLLLLVHPGKRHLSPFFLPGWAPWGPPGYETLVGPPSNTATQQT